METKLTLYYTKYQRGPDEITVTDGDDRYTFEVPANPHWGSGPKMFGQLLEDLLNLRATVQQMEDAVRDLQTDVRYLKKDDDYPY